MSTPDAPKAPRYGSSRLRVRMRRLFFPVAARAKLTFYGGSSSAGRASDCGSECRGFKSHLPPQNLETGSALEALPLPKVVTNRQLRYLFEQLSGSSFIFRENFTCTNTPSTVSSPCIVTTYTDFNMEGHVPRLGPGVDSRTARVGGCIGVASQPIYMMPPEIPLKPSCPRHQKQPRRKRN